MSFVSPLGLEWSRGHCADGRFDVLLDAVWEWRFDVIGKRMDDLWNKSPFSSGSASSSTCIFGVQVKWMR